MDEAQQPLHHFDDPRHQHLSKYFQNAMHEGRLGSGRRESPRTNLWKVLVQTFPTMLLLLQLIWSGAVVVMGYFISEAQSSSPTNDTLSVAFWKSKLNVSTSVTSGVGWALFVLLGFYIRAASNRYVQAQHSIYRAGCLLVRIVRVVRQSFPEGSWHPGDRDRIIAHLIAYPLALKMTLRDERDIELLKTVLHPRDAADVIAARSMHFHCMRVVKSYLIVADDMNANFKACNTVEKAQPGVLTRMAMGVMTDGVDEATITAFRISQFRPSIAYINHLKIFLLIWMMFLPLTLVHTSGWFTILWAVLISYMVAMLSLLAEALDHPFGFDEQDIKLNVLGAEIAHNVLVSGYATKMEYSDVIDKDHETPTWLEDSLAKGDLGKVQSKYGPGAKSTSTFALKRTGKFRWKKHIIFTMLAYLLWSTFIVLLTWGLRKDLEGEDRDSERWWTVYIPITDKTASYLSLAVSTLLGFWLTDSYNRYWRALQLWKTSLQPMLVQYAYHFAVCAKRGHWHNRDRERILSHITAFPYALMLQLRHSRDVSILSGILSEKDLHALSTAPHLTGHILDVIYGYLRSSDRRHFRGTPLFAVPLSIEPNNMPRLEDLVIECEAVSKFVVSPAFTVHLIIMAASWLITLPLTLVLTTGWVSFAFTIPIGYSYIKLISVGRELADPYGNDADDLDLEHFCQTIKESIITTYRETSSPADARYYIRASSKYDRAALTPRPPPPGTEHPDTVHHHITLTRIIQMVWSVIPSVPPLALAISILWAVAAVFASWGLGKLWDEAVRYNKNDGCIRWCSPVDVPPKTLGNVGYALFLILAFRASDALSRYDDGTSCFTELQMMLRTCAVESVQFIGDGTFHDGDKERIVAHLAQIPLLFGDILLKKNDLANGGFLCPEDRAMYESSEDPMAYLIKTVEAYFLTPDVQGVGSDGEELRIKKKPVSGQLTFTASMRMGRIRSLIAKVLIVKEFPVVRSYKKHQRLFSAMWIGLLPFAMTKQTGFFTILWVILIAYTVLSLENLAMKLVDPYGEDAGDLPVRDLCSKASAAVLDAVDAVRWGTDAMVHESVVDNKPRLAATINGSDVFNKYTVASTAPFKDVDERNKELEDGEGGSSSSSTPKLDDDGIIDFCAPREARTVTSLYAHFIKSVPWATLAAISVWTAAAVVISYVTRDYSLKLKWWRSIISVSTNVAKYISIGTLALLGFYVRAAFARYNNAARFWGDDLQGYCHKMTTTFLYLFPVGELHKDDHRRIIGHIAALPLILKHELRHSRDIREIKGLLSSSDISHLLCAPSMSSACVDVIRSYFYKIIGRPETLESDLIKPGLVFIPIWVDIRSLEQAVEMVKRLNEFDIAPLFTSTLKALLGVWFIVLPFVLGEKTGWLTILWVIIISYGILGMYNIAAELQHPFGNDMNDLDLDTLADDIVADVLQVYRLRKRGTDVVSTPGKTEATIWKEPGLAVDKSIFSEQDELSTFQSFKQSMWLAVHPVPWWMLLGVAGWSALSVWAAYLVNKHLPQAQNDKCGPWFCSALAIDKNVKEYLGFALFLLLAFRLGDSHGRYVNALRIWQDKIIGSSRLLSQRLFGSHGPGPWHPGGREHVAGHLAAYSTCLLSALRGESYENRLRDLLSEEDVKKVIRMKRPADYCMDTVLNYLLEGEKKIGKKQGVDIAKMELMALMILWRKLGLTANDCQVVKTIPMPYGYVIHLRIFMMIWIMLLPLGIVETNGWVSILWVTIIAYGVIGVERWASELADPFGHDLSDVPLEPLCDVVNNVIKNEFNVYKDGIQYFIQKNRPPFPEMKQDVVGEAPQELPTEIV